MGTKPLAAVEHLQGWETRLGCGFAALDHDIIPARESGRFGLHAETGRVGVWAGFNPASRKAIPTHRLYCCCGALVRWRVLVSAGPSAFMARRDCRAPCSRRVKRFSNSSVCSIPKFRSASCPIDRKLLPSFDIHSSSSVGQI